jgi:hypothetical protein
LIEDGFQLFSGSEAKAVARGGVAEFDREDLLLKL